MPRLTATAVAVLTFALAGVALVVAPAHATGAPAGSGGATTAPRPCPLPEADLARGRRLVGRAVGLVDQVRVRLGADESRPTMTAEPRPLDIDDLSLCLIALQDLNDKMNAADEAFDRWAACLAAALLDGRSCGGEESNMRAAAHSLEVALNNLQSTCPWLFPY